MPAVPRGYVKILVGIVLMLFINDQRPCIPLRLHPSGLVECFLLLGADKQRLLRDAALHEEDFRDSTKKISIAQQHALTLSGLEQCDESSLGLKVGLKFPWCYYGELAPIIDCSPTLEEAGAAFRRYTAIAQPVHKAFFAKINFYLEQIHTLVVPIDSPYTESMQSKIYQFDLDFRLAILMRLFDACGYKGGDYSGMTLRLKRPPPAGEDPYRQLPAVKIDYCSSENAIAANHQFFTATWRPFRQHTFQRAIASCEKAYHEAGLYESLEEHVRWYVDMNFNRDVHIEQIAEIIGLSARSLSRKLSIQGTSFREIVHQSRMNLAMHHVRFSKMGAEEIADVLGFSSKSSLMRAIKNWSGLTFRQIQQSCYVFKQDTEKNCKTEQAC